MPATESRTDVKTMIYIIGVSYSIEYAIKGIYENTIGRVFEWIRGDKRTPQDDYARAVLQDYAAFLYTIPWYKYPFRDKLNGFMAISTPTPSTARTIERGFALGSEYFIKIGYAALIQKALDASSDDEPRDIMFVVGDLAAGGAGSRAAHQADPRAVAAMAAGADAALQGFHRDRARPARSRHSLGRDRGEPRDHDHGDRAECRGKLDVKDATELFSLDLDAKPGFRRAGLKARIDRLVEIVRELKARGASIEHFYDY